jgi:hypothetical protein
MIEREKTRRVLFAPSSLQHRKNIKQSDNNKVLQRDPRDIKKFHEH